MRKPLDITDAVDKYLGMTEVCVDMALAALARRLGSRKAALKAWWDIERRAARRRNERSLVRLGDAKKGR